MEETHAPRQSVKEILDALHKKFGSNLDLISEEKTTQLFDSIDINSRTISEIKAALIKNCNGFEPHKKKCAEILDEVFSDFSLAMYLSSIGLNVPARMSARRGFEQALAVVYMWDLPHEYWGWIGKDLDLSFSAMINHLNSSGYLEFMSKIGSQTTSNSFCDQAKFQKIYRILSNTVHGKTADLPPLSPQRFSSDQNGLDENLNLIIDTQNAIIQMLLERFFEVQKITHNTLPPIKRP